MPTINPIAFIPNIQISSYAAESRPLTRTIYKSVLNILKNLAWFEVIFRQAAFFL